MTDHDLPSDDVLLAYLRGELDPAATRDLGARLRAEPALREQLRWLQDMAGVALVGHFDTNEQESFQRLQHQIHATDAQRSSPVANSRWQHLREWLRGHALVLQSGLAVLVVAQAVTLSAILQRSPSPQSASSTPPVAVVRGASENCLAVTVTFRPGATLQQVTQWLDQYGANIKSGPGADGSYRIAATTTDSLHALLGDPGTSKLIAAHRAPAGCSP